jgi:hypothetical protein
LEDAEVANDKSRLSATAYKIMLYEGIRVNKSEEVGEEWLSQTYCEGFDANRERLLNVKLETD